MKKVLMTLAIASLSLCVMADNTPNKPKRGRPRSMMRPSGGIVEKEYNGNVLRVFNAQSEFQSEPLKALTQKIRWTSLIPVEVVDGTIAEDGCPVKTADELVKDPKVGAGVVLIDNPKFPIYLTSPDSRWAIMNVAPLKADTPSAETFSNRFTKVYWGAVARSLGVGNSGYPGCVLVPFTNMRELDRIMVTQPCPEPFNKMIDSAAAYGIRTLSIASYRTACQQGWAPPPKDDVQRKIMEETDSEKERGPVNGLTIPPPSKAK